MSIYNVIIIGFWLVFILVWLLSSFFTKSNSRGGFSLQGTLARILALFIVLFVFKITNIHNASQYINSNIGNSVFGIIGTILCGLGITFAIWARIYLGRNWGMPMSEKENPELVTSGPYVYVRHPIYTGVILAILGSAFVAGFLWFVIVVTACLYFIYSAKKEEQRLIQLFPEQYPEYMKKTKMLIPFVF